MQTKRWKHRPPGSNWGEFGPDDQRGRMNWVTPEKVLQGVAEVTEGLTFVLSLPLDYPGGSALNPRRHPPRLAATHRNGRQNFAYEVRQDNPMQTDVVCDDLVLLTLQYSTQWDSFAHVGSLFDADGDGTPEPVFYNGFRAGQDIVPAKANPDAESWNLYEGTRAEALGIQNLAEHGVQGRGVMIDLHAHHGRKRVAIGYEELMRILEADKVTVDRGDIVCLHTGFAEMVMEFKKNPTPEALHNTCTGLDGRDDKLLQWVTDSGLSVLAADNYAVELFSVKPWKSSTHAMLPLHQHCLFKNGIHLGELWYFTRLAGWLREHKRNRFLLTAPPLRLPGAVGSPATPVATV
ncbi:MAG TPA: cyclase family protein [Burkholderiales bacterium]|nr:cyclase family protein [Burkholderiales bacterium]